MKRWDCNLGKSVEETKIDLFLHEIDIVCQKHGLSISHEDRHGAFEIERYNDSLREWLNDAHVGRQ